MGNIKILVLLCFISISAHLCSASAGEELWRITKGLHQVFKNSLNPVEIHLKIKDFHDSKLINTVTKEKKLRDKSISELENNTNKTLNRKTLGFSLKTNATQSTTISKTKELSGEVQLPFFVPNVNEKMVLKFSEAASLQISNTKEVTKNVPSITVELKPHTKYSDHSQLFVKEITYTYALSFELDMCDPKKGMRSVEVIHSNNCSRILFNDGVASTKPTVTYLSSFLKTYIEDTLKTSSYPVYIRDRETNEKVLEITGPLPGGKVYLSNVLMNVVIEQPIYESETEINSIPN